MYRYQLSKYGQWTVEWGTVAQMGEDRRNMFLDFLFDEDEALLLHDSVNKLKIFYNNCYESTLNEEDIASTALLNNFIEMVNFTDSSSDIWDDTISNKFMTALSWMSLRGWNDLLILYSNIKDDAIIILWLNNCTE